MQDAVDKQRRMGSFKAGLDWVYRSVFLFRQNPPKWLIHALLYAVLFIMLPSVPAMPVLIRYSSALRATLRGSRL